MKDELYQSYLLQKKKKKKMRKNGVNLILL
jgi:hypothetical protein